MDLARLWREWCLFVLTYYGERGGSVSVSCTLSGVKVSIEVYPIVYNVVQCLENILKNFARSMCSEMVKLAPLPFNINVEIRDCEMKVFEEVSVEGGDYEYIFDIGYGCHVINERFLYCDRFVTVEDHGDHFESVETGYNLSYDVMTNIYRKLTKDVGDLLDHRMVDGLVKSLILFSEGFYELGKRIKGDVALCELYP